MTTDERYYEQISESLRHDNWAAQLRDLLAHSDQPERVIDYCLRDDRLTRAWHICISAATRVTNEVIRRRLFEMVNGPYETRIREDAFVSLFHSDEAFQSQCEKYVLSDTSVSLIALKCIFSLPDELAARRLTQLLPSLRESMMRRTTVIYLGILRQPIALDPLKRYYVSDAARASRILRTSLACALAALRLPSASCDVLSVLSNIDSVEKLLVRTHFRRVLAASDLSDQELDKQIEDFVRDAN